MRTADFGSLSTGTLLNADLVQVLSGELAALAEPSDTSASALLNEVLAWNSNEEDDTESGEHGEVGSELVQELIDALQEAAPPYAYFGAHPSDGADFGFWLSEDFESDFDGLKVDDTSEVPSDYVGEVLHVSDHGNPTLYSAKAGELTEIWSLV